MGEIDVTEYFDRFREAIRHLWNTSFDKSFGPQRDIFDNIESLLFSAIILQPLNVRGLIGSEVRLYDPEQLPLHDSKPIFRLTPTGLCGAPVMISADDPSKGKWDHPVHVLTAEDSKVRFNHFFDWDERGYRDWKYYRGTIEKAKESSIEGHEVLIEVQYVKVFIEVLPNKTRDTDAAK